MCVLSVLFFFFFNLTLRHSLHIICILFHSVLLCAVSFSLRLSIDRSRCCLFCLYLWLFFQLSCRLFLASLATASYITRSHISYGVRSLRLHICKRLSSSTFGFCLVSFIAFIRFFLVRCCSCSSYFALALPFAVSPLSAIGIKSQRLPHEYDFMLYRKKKKQPYAWAGCTFDFSWFWNFGVATSAFFFFSDSFPCKHFFSITAETIPVGDMNMWSAYKKNRSKKWQMWLYFRRKKRRSETHFYRKCF